MTDGPQQILHRRARARSDTAKPNADTIRARFLELGITQGEFVEHRGFTLRTFQRALAGARISKVALRKIAEALGLAFDRVVARRAGWGAAPPGDTGNGAAIDGPPRQRLCGSANDLRFPFQRATQSTRAPFTDPDVAAVGLVIDRILTALDTIFGKRDPGRRRTE